MLGISQVRVEGSRIRPRDFLGVKVSEDKSLVQSTGEGFQRVKDERKKRALDWYGNVQVYRGDLAQGSTQQVEGLYT